MNKIQEEIMGIYQSFYERIVGDFQNKADAKQVAAQLTTAYYEVAAGPEPEEPKLENVIPIKFTGGLNGSKY